MTKISLHLQNLIEHCVDKYGDKQVYDYLFFIDKIQHQQKIRTCFISKAFFYAANYYNMFPGDIMKMNHQKRVSFAYGENYRVVTSALIIFLNRKMNLSARHIAEMMGKTPKRVYNNYLNAKNLNKRIKEERKILELLAYLNKKYREYTKNLILYND